MTPLLAKVNSLGERKVMAVLLIVTAVIYLALINADPTPNKMEARNLVAARECVQDGHWLVTTMNGVPRVRKPPLPTWLAAIAMKTAGDTSNIHVARLPSVMVVGMLALFVYRFARKWLDRSLGLTASLVAVTSLIMCGGGRRAAWDSLPHPSPSAASGCSTARSHATAGTGHGLQGQVSCGGCPF